MAVCKLSCVSLIHVLVILATFSKALVECPGTERTSEEIKIDKELLDGRRLEYRLDEFILEYHKHLEPHYRGNLDEKARDLKNLTTAAAVDGVDRARLKRKLVNYYYRYNPDQVESRELITTVLVDIEVGEEVIKQAMKRFPSYQNQNQSFFDEETIDFAKFVSMNYNMSKALRLVQENSLPKAVYLWPTVLEAVWKCYRFNSSFEETIRSHCNSVKQKLTELKLQVKNEWDQVPQDNSTFISPLHEKLIIKMQNKFIWAEQFVNEYLAWIETKRRPLPGGEQCSTPKLIPAEVNAEYPMHVLLFKLPFDGLEQRLMRASVQERIQKFNSTIKELLPQHEAIVVELYSSLHTIPKENFHEGFQTAKAYHYLRGLIEFEKNFINRSDFYKGQPRKYFRWSLHPNVARIERELEEIDTRFEELAVKRASGCLFWTEEIETQIKSISNNSTSKANLIETFELLKDKAEKAKEKMEQIQSLATEYPTLYLRPETEFQLNAHKFFYNGIVVMFDEHLKSFKSV